MEQRRELVREILECVENYEVLDLSDRQGHTGYIDFIRINEVTSPVMRGMDMFGRPFITVLADIKYVDDTTVSTFTTFFKRYTDAASCVWHSCGVYRKLMETNGGMNIPQFTFLRDLLKNGSVVFDDGRDDESIEGIRLKTYIAGDDEDHIRYSHSYKRPSCVSLSVSKY